MLKNALDWLVASGESYEKPVALFSASPRGTYAQASLTETLNVMMARVVPEACISVPLLGKKSRRVGYYRGTRNLERSLFCLGKVRRRDPSNETVSPYSSH